MPSTHELIMLLDRCKCDLCQAEKIKLEQKLQTGIKPMIKEPKECSFCKQKASDYEWMFLEQRDIAAGYRKMIEELKKEINELRAENVKLNWATKGSGGMP